MKISILLHIYINHSLDVQINFILGMTVFGKHTYYKLVVEREDMGSNPVLST